MHTTAEFSLTRRDFNRFQRLAGRRLRADPQARAIRTGTKVVVWLLLASALFICFRTAGDHPALASAQYLMAALAVAAALVASVSPHLVRARLARRIVVEGGAFLRPHALQFSETAVVTTWTSGHAHYPWPDFLCRDHDEINVYLYVDGCSAIIVPRAAVASFEHDFERYIAAIPVC